MATEIISDHVALPLVRKVPSADDFQPALFRLARIESLENAWQLVRQAFEGRSWKDIVDALAISSVGRKTLAPAVKDMAPRIDLAHREDFEPSANRLILPDAATHQTPNTEGCFHVTVNIDALVHVQVSIRSALDGVQNMVGVLGAEAAEQDFTAVRLAVTVSILHEQQFSGVRHVDPAVLRPDAGGDEQTLIKDGAFVGLAVVVGVLDDENPVSLTLTWLDVRIDGAAGDPQSALCIPCHLDGLGHHWFGSKQVDLHAIGDLERGKFLGGIG